MRSRCIDFEHLGAAVDADKDTSWAVRARAELPVDVADMRAGDDRHMQTSGGQLLDERAAAGGARRLDLAAVMSACRQENLHPTGRGGAECETRSGSPRHARIGDAR
jgi:hypothetical protein